MKRIVLLFLFIAFSVSAFGQSNDPKYYQAISVEYSYVPGIFIYGNFYPDNLEYSLRVGKKVYVQAGLFCNNADEVPGESFFKNGFAVYGGSAMKFFLFRHHGFLHGSAYFTPSVNLYVDFYGKNSIEYDASITAGPTLAVEYYFSDRISLRIDVLNVNIGVGVPYNDFVGTVHRVLGIGLRYNFDSK